MAINTDKVKLGICNAVFKGADLGATKGGVEVDIKTETYEVKVDQTGETPVKEIITGTTVTVKVPMAEHDLTRLGLMLPQSVTTPAGGAIPTSRTSLGTLAVAASVVTVDGSGGGALAVNQSVSFAGHQTVYSVVAVSGSDITIVPKSGGVGLIAPVAAGEAMTFTAASAGVEIRTGVNIDLIDVAGILKLHPNQLPAGDTSQDFTLFRAAPNPNFNFKYELNAERVYEVTFKGYPDTTNNDRIAAFGATNV